ncbi:MAG TPA: alpha-E domain-containing protein [Spongiibacteraceae bacterium]|nr:alpha-E domain-containing protein [Spongiibacteraceae bacterium]
MLARVAENIYWMARYLERAEGMARLISVTANLTLDLPKGLSPMWGQLIAITGSEADYSSNDYDEKAVLKFLISDTHTQVSILSCLACARENARTIRDVIPRDVWEIINTLYLYAREQAPQATSKRGRFAFLDEIISQCQKLTGMFSGTMNHDAGYLFLRIGRYLERSDMTSRIVDIRSSNLLPDATTTQATYENLQWMSVLRSLSGYQMYRRAMQLRVQRTEVLRFLFQSEVFPRSLNFCVNAVKSAVDFLPHHDNAKLVVHRVKRQLDNAQIDKLKQAELQAFVDQLQIGFAQIHDELQGAYFSGLGAASAA